MPAVVVFAPEFVLVLELFTVIVVICWPLRLAALLLLPCCDPNEAIPAFEFRWFALLLLSVWLLLRPLSDLCLRRLSSSALKVPFEVFVSVAVAAEDEDEETEEPDEFPI